MTVSKVALFIVLALTAPLSPACSRTPAETMAQETPASPQAMMEARAAAIIEALSSGDPKVYDAAARENYAAPYYAARTPDQRAQFVDMVSADFGPLEIRQIAVGEDSANVTVIGDKGPAAIFTFTFEETGDRRITRIDISADDGGDGGDDAIDGPRMPPPPVNPDMSAADMAAAIDSWLGPVLDHDDFSGAIVIARNGAPLVQKTYGFADRASAAPVDADTTFNIASIGKKFTQVAIARLIEDGRLSLETTVGEVLTDYRVDETRAATIRQLIEMEGGVADFFGDGFADLPKEKLAANHDYYEYVASLPARFAPGEQREYCNGCYVVLGEIVERIAGTPFEDYVQRTVFDPAGMTRTGYFNAAALPENAAQLYERADGPGSDYVNARDRHGAAGSGAGGAYSTALDLLAFDNALRDGRLLNPDLTAWVLDGDASGAERNATPIGIAGGAPGTNALLESNGEWAVIVTANVSPPLPGNLGMALARRLER